MTKTSHSDQGDGHESWEDYFYRHWLQFLGLNFVICVGIIQIMDDLKGMVAKLWYVEVREYKMDYALCLVMAIAWTLQVRYGIKKRLDCEAKKALNQKTQSDGGPDSAK